MSAIEWKEAGLVTVFKRFFNAIANFMLATACPFWL
jgi:hypothetical protein